MAKGNCPVTIGEDAILRRPKSSAPSFRSTGSELLTDDDVATLTRLAGEGMGSLIVFRRLIWPSACC